MTDPGPQLFQRTELVVSGQVKGGILSVILLLTLLTCTSFAEPILHGLEGSRPLETHDRVSGLEGFEPAYLTTRRDAIVTYVQALQAPEGYFHAYLTQPPPFEPDGTSPSYTSTKDAYDTLLYINRTSSIDWASTKEFLATLVNQDTGLLNISKEGGLGVGSCHHALTFYSEIGLGHLIDEQANAQYVAELQQTNGGFLFDASSSKPTLVATYASLEVLRLTGTLDMVDLDMARDFLSRCSHASGGFSNTVDTSEDIFVAPAGIMIADILGVLDDSVRNKTAEYLLSNWNPTKGCDSLEDLYITERIAWSLALLDRRGLIDSVKMAKWVLNLQKHRNGEFVGYPKGTTERLVNARDATHILYLYNETFRLDVDFSVVSEPVWEIPDWWLEYIEEEWGTTTAGPGSGFHFSFPDLSVLIGYAPFAALALILLTPAIWIVNRKRVERNRRRLLKKQRKKRRKGPLIE